MSATGAAGSCAHILRYRPDMGETNCLPKRLRELSTRRMRVAPALDVAAGPQPFFYWRER